ncbi:N-formylglutamate deformylase [Maricaulis maris]|uniref:N-formylglutamate deformylase/formiminoglutamase n=1 Tax=Maricaulis maris TaxID=74318 RepID=A0A495DK37_9PROT|nr:N-formylglutamate deformylase [Maricaulis maris]RKR02961.1 N-formylglutamate deformylase/formiminoglutamase [Maricaulis maris]
MDVFTLRRGTSPLVVSMPHSGTALAPGLADRLSEPAGGLPDTDWHIPELYDFLDAMGATVIRANYSRYVIDLNRDPTGTSLYPGQATTDLVPTTLFDGTPIYKDGEAPHDAEIEQRRTEFYDPYHRALTETLMATRMEHGYALLWDAHSIASQVPRLFEGVLPDLNLGTNGGESCDRMIERWAVKAMMDHEEYASIVNGRFKGGFITRVFGRPSQNIHALQMELAQSAYMSEAPPWTLDTAKADQLRAALKDVMKAALDAAKNLYSGEVK